MLERELKSEVRRSLVRWQSISEQGRLIHQFRWIDPVVVAAVAVAGAAAAAVDWSAPVAFAWCGLWPEGGHRSQLTAQVINNTTDERRTEQLQSG